MKRNATAVWQGDLKSGRGVRDDHRVYRPETLCLPEAIL